MRNTLDKRLRGLLRRLIKEAMLSGSQPDESYSNRMIDDLAFNKKSIYVSDDIKDAIKKWLKDMKLD